MIPATPQAYQLMHEGTLALADVEAYGIRMDTQFLREAEDRVSEEIHSRIKELKSGETWQRWKRRFRDKSNLGSRQQLGTVLYEEMGVPCQNYTESGLPSTKEDDLELIEHPFVEDYLKVAKLSKLKSTYITGIQREVIEGYLHPIWSLNLAETYRSCVARGTLIEVTTNRRVPVEMINTNRIVYCYDERGVYTRRKVLWAGRTGHKPVLRLHWKLLNKVGHVDLTPEHPVRMPDGHYVIARNLPIGCELMGVNGKRPVLMAIEQLPEPVDVFDLEVHVCHNFIAGGICVHNSSDSPNFQNIPVRNPETSKWIRPAFIPRPGNTFLEIDYGQLEVRAAACLHKDPTMLNYIETNHDMHSDMARECFLLDPEEVTKKSRFVAKNSFVFAEFYGSVYTNVAMQMWFAIQRENLELPDGTPMKEHLKSKGITRLGNCDLDKEAKSGTFEKHIQEVERVFWNERFPVYKKWRDDWWKKYCRKGGFRNKTGFAVNGVYSRNQVINSPVQSIAFHCLLWSLIQLNRIFHKKQFGTRIIGQIHDSLILDVPNRELPDVLHLCQRVMTQDIRKHWNWIIVPLVIEAEGSEVNWHEKKGIKIG